MSIYFIKALFHKYFVAMKYKFYFFILSESPALSSDNMKHIHEVNNVHPLMNGKQYKHERFNFNNI